MQNFFAPAAIRQFNWLKWFDCRRSRQFPQIERLQ